MLLLLYGSKLHRNGTGKSYRTEIQGRHILKPHARPSGLPQDICRVSQMQETVLRHIAFRRVRHHQHRRQERNGNGPEYKGEGSDLFLQKHRRPHLPDYRRRIRRDAAQNRRPGSMDQTDRTAQCLQPPRHLHCRNMRGRRP